MTNIHNTNNWKGGTDAPENCKHADNGSIDVNLHNKHGNMRYKYLVLPVYIFYIFEYSVSVSYLRWILYECKLKVHTKSVLLLGQGKHYTR